MLRRWLDRLFPAHTQQRPALSAEQRRDLLSQVGEQDPCLRAVNDMLGDLLVYEAQAAFNSQLAPEARLRAVERMSIARELLRMLEEERAAAQAWVKQGRPR